MNTQSTSYLSSASQNPIKVGDSIIRRVAGQPRRICTVERKTRTLVILNTGERLRLTTRTNIAGRTFLEEYGANPFSRSSYQVPDSVEQVRQARAEIAARNARVDLDTKLRRLDPTTLSDEAIKLLSEALEAIEKL